MPPVPTIAVVLKGYPRLSETFIAQELRGLEQSGFRLRFYSMRRPTDRKLHQVHREMQAAVAYLPEYLHQEPLRVLRGLARCCRRPGFRSALAAWIGDLRRDFTRNRWRRFGQACVLAAELPADVAHLYAHFIHTPAAVTRYAALISGLPWTCSAHAKDIWTSSEQDLQLSLASARWVATCTAVGHAHLQGLAGSSGRVHLIYHGLDLGRFPLKPAALEPEHPRDGSDPLLPVRLLCVGRAVEKKGIDTLLRALARLPADRHWQLQHIGGGSERARLEALATELAIADRVRWRGAEDQSAVLEAYRASDLFVLACRVADDGDRDGLPNVLVEAQSQRLACLSTFVSAVPELIVDGVTGRLVAPDDPSALANAIDALVRAPHERARLAEAGEARVRAAFDYRVGLEQLAALFPSSLRATVGSTDTAVPASPSTTPQCCCADEAVS